MNATASVTDLNFVPRVAHALLEPANRQVRSVRATPIVQGRKYRLPCTRCLLLNSSAALFDDPDKDNWSVESRKRKRVQAQAKANRPVESRLCANPPKCGRVSGTLSLSQFAIDQ